jgi:hypothetical protein
MDVFWQGCLQSVLRRSVGFVERMSKAERHRLRRVESDLRRALEQVSGAGLGARRKGE